MFKFNVEEKFLKNQSFLTELKYDLNVWAYKSEFL